MDPQTILRSDFLDILFENRNKEYGAYMLRKEYDHRMYISLGLLTAFIAVSCFILVENKNYEAPKIVNKMPFDYTLSKKREDVKKPQPAIKQHAVRKMSEVIYPPRIVNYKTEDPIMQPTDADPETGSSPDGSISGIENHEPGSGNGKDTAVAHQQVLKSPADDEPIDHPDVMPEFPGGTPALIKFLFDNLVSPEDLQENEFHDVRIRFVVDESGVLTDMKVAQSGGNAFDREVLRVLRKMPHWHPGKFHEKNVNVYFTLPVKFSASNN